MYQATCSIGMEPTEKLTPIAVKWERPYGDDYRLISINKEMWERLKEAVHVELFFLDLEDQTHKKLCFSWEEVPSGKRMHLDLDIMMFGYLAIGFLELMLGKTAV